MLEKEGISNAKRMTTRSGHNTSLVEATATGKSNYDRLIKEGFKLGLWSKSYKVTPKNSMIQCFKCLKLGHLKARCPSKNPVCINCGQNDCTAFMSGATCLNAAHCTNCNGAHSGVSRKCPVLKEVETKQKENHHKVLHCPTNHPNAWQQNDPSHPLSTTNAQSAVSRPLEDKVKNEIIESVVEKLNVIIESKIDSLLNHLFDKMLVKLNSLPQPNPFAHDSGSNSPSPLRQTQTGTKKSKAANISSSISNAFNSMLTDNSRRKSSGILPYISSNTDHTKRKLQTNYK